MSGFSDRDLACPFSTTIYGTLNRSSHTYWGGDSLDSFFFFLGEFGVELELTLHDASYKFDL